MNPFLYLLRSIILDITAWCKRFFEKILYIIQINNFWYNYSMKKRFVRWYEKDEYLNAFMNLLEDLEPEIQCEIAIDIIIKASDLIDRDYIKFVQEVGDYNPKDYKRWYDRNPNIHLAIEALRDLKEHERELVVKEFSQKILNNHYIKLESID